MGSDPDGRCRYCRACRWLGLAISRSRLFIVGAIRRSRQLRRQRHLRRLPSAEAKLWSASQHQLAMRMRPKNRCLAISPARRSAITTFNRASSAGDGKYFVETDGPDGKLATFEIKYTFGVEPLQQYLVEFPDGRLQALSIAWDTRPKDQGGQRWFHLYPTRRSITMTCCTGPG